eukprot:633820-Hanusia_phi.AAC.1
MKLFPASSLPPAPSSSPLVPPKVSYGRRRLHVCHAGAGKEEWWEARGQVPFACTECGKCCQVYGDVWCAPAEVSGLMEYFSMTREEVSSNFGKMEVDGWLLLKDKSFGDSQGCIFLSEDKKTCGIYENRPVQCRVYPFFPRIMKTPEVGGSEPLLPWRVICVLAVLECRGGESRAQSIFWGRRGEDREILDC